MPRNVHISVIKICAMQNIQPIFFDLDFSSENGHYKPITKNWLKNIFKKINFNEQKIVGVILVSPSYHGYAGDLGPLIDLCHKKIYLFWLMKLMVLISFFVKTLTYRNPH